MVVVRPGSSLRWPLARNSLSSEEGREGGLPGGGSPSIRRSLGKAGLPGRGRKASKHRSGNRLRKWKKSMYGVLGAGGGGRGDASVDLSSHVRAHIQKSF